jgi:hypothetical protein
LEVIGCMIAFFTFNFLGERTEIEKLREKNKRYESEIGSFAPNLSAIRNDMSIFTTNIQQSSSNLRAIEKSQADLYNAQGGLSTAFNSLASKIEVLAHAAKLIKDKEETLNSEIKDATNTLENFVAKAKSEMAELDNKISKTRYEPERRDAIFEISKFTRRGDLMYATGRFTNELVFRVKTKVESAAKQVFTVEQILIDANSRELSIELSSALKPDNIIVPSYLSPAFSYQEGDRVLAYVALFPTSDGRLPKLETGQTFELKFAGGESFVAEIPSVYSPSNVLSRKIFLATSNLPNYQYMPPSAKLFEQFPEPSLTTPVEARQSGIRILRLIKPETIIVARGRQYQVFNNGLIVGHGSVLDVYDSK